LQTTEHFTPERVSTDDETAEMQAELSDRTDVADGIGAFVTTSTGWSALFDACVDTADALGSWTGSISV
jgi:hypothetical protein